MKKHFLAMSSIFLSVIMLFSVFNITNAYTPYMPYIPISSSLGFGGRIISTTAVEIRTLENAGYTCEVPGETITIAPVGKYPTSYLIPFGVESRSMRPLGNNRWILGSYKPITTPITCTSDDLLFPDVKIVNLHPLVIYANS